MCDCGTPVFIMRDSHIESMPNGDETIYWVAEGLWDKLRDARGMQLAWKLLSADFDARVRVMMQFSLDGRTWATAPGQGSNGLLPEDIALAPSNSPQQTLGAMASGSRRLYLSDVVSAAPFVRIGVAIRDDNEAQLVEARLDVIVTPVKGGGDAYLDTKSFNPAPTPGELQGPAISVQNVDSITFLVSISSFATGTDADMQVYTSTSDDVNSGGWTAVGETTRFTGDGTISVSANTGLSRYAALGIAAATGNPTFTSYAVATLRMR